MTRGTSMKYAWNAVGVVALARMIPEVVHTTPLGTLCKDPERLHVLICVLGSRMQQNEKFAFTLHLGKCDGMFAAVLACQFEQVVGSVLKLN